jgi:CubicO group peptidase (beta-lactamase class C family)
MQGTLAESPGRSACLGMTRGETSRPAGSTTIPLMPIDANGPTEGALVTAGNWQEPPFNRWAYWHLREILPTQLISRGSGSVRSLPGSSSAVDLASIEITRVDGSPGTVGQVLDESYTDAYLVLQDGELVGESYNELGAVGRPHAVMSVGKSVVGCVAAVLIARGDLDADAEITAYIPELSGSGFAGATVRQVLDMRTGVRFREDYTDPDAEVRQLDHWIGWRPSPTDEVPRGLYDFLTTLQADAPHGGRFLYRSAETDVLGWVCERAAGVRMADLISTLIWQPMGAEHDAEILCDGLGTAVHDGGLCVTARDLGRFGQLLLDGGTVADGSAGGVRTVLPPSWLRQAWAVDSDVRAAFAASPSEQSMPGGWYRNQFWFRPGEQGDVLLCLGIHGQMLHVSRRTRTVCVKFSTWPQAQQPAFLQNTLRAFDAVGAVLAGRERGGERHRLPGVVSGLSRSGSTAAPRGRSVV